MIDFHTHHPSCEGETVVEQGVHCWGIHPKNITISTVVELPEGDWLAVGECGIDKRLSVSIDRQMEIFAQHVRLSEARRLPLILHCVRAWDEVFEVRRKLQPQMPWMAHGYSGRWQRMRRLLDAGMYISFGYTHSPESVAQCPLNRLMIETDARSMRIDSMYAKIAQERGTDVATLKEAMARNYAAFFGREPK